MVLFNIRSVRKLGPGNITHAVTQADLDEADARRDNEEVDADLRHAEGVRGPKPFLWTALSYPNPAPELMPEDDPEEEVDSDA